MSKTDYKQLWRRGQKKIRELEIENNNFRTIIREIQDQSKKIVKDSKKGMGKMDIKVLGQSEDVEVVK
jgi:translation initiation factor 2 beta subunit (eIF-2beta)/eIF-5